MRSLAVLIAAVAVLVAGVDVGSAQSVPTTVDGLIGAAKVAAGAEWSGTFLTLCIPGPAPSSGRARETWYGEPAKVADNFYFIGTKIHNAWALAGSDGIIVIEALFDYAAQEEIFGGLRKVGLDPNKVKYVILSHAHADHDGGAKLLQDEIPDVHLIYGAADWDAVDTSTNHAGGKPKRDMVGADGMKVSVPEPIGLRYRIAFQSPLLRGHARNLVK